MNLVNKNLRAERVPPHLITLFTNAVKSLYSSSRGFELLPVSYSCLSCEEVLRRGSAFGLSFMCSFSSQIAVSEAPYLASEITAIRKFLDAVNADSSLDHIHIRFGREVIFTSSELTRAAELAQISDISDSGPISLSVQSLGSVRQPIYPSIPAVYRPSAPHLSCGVFPPSPGFEIPLVADAMRVSESVNGTWRCSSCSSPNSGRGDVTNRCSNCSAPRPPPRPSEMPE